tara:strand:+ start:2093 stop:2302 length:210 start_codon:yes stop_codon:yes gene_type:complete
MAVVIPVLMTMVFIQCALLQQKNFLTFLNLQETTFLLRETDSQDLILVTGGVFALHDGRRLMKLDVLHK